MKKIFSILLISFVLLFNVNFAFAGKYDNIAGENDVIINPVDEISEGTLTKRSLIEIIGGVIKVILGLSGLVTFVFLILGGVEIIASQGNKDAIIKAKGRIISACVGVLIISISYAITDFVLKQIDSVTK